MKDNTKPVWRMNTGVGVPSDLGNKVLYFDGHRASMKNSSKKRYDDDLWEFECEPFELDIYAYQTNRTKPAKYGSVICDDCLGGGEDIDWEDDSCPPIIGTTCAGCKGTGHVWEAL